MTGERGTEGSRGIRSEDHRQPEADGDNMNNQQKGSLVDVVRQTGDDTHWQAAGVGMRRVVALIPSLP